MTDWSGVPTMACRNCHTDVPAGTFCGVCGSHLTRQPADGPDWLRLKAFAAAPTERVLRLAVTSSLFPQLPRSSRGPFRVGLTALALTLVVFSLLRWQAPMIAVAALGLPAAFLIYLYETDAFDDIPAHLLTLSTVLGVLLGVGWALLTGRVVSRSYISAVGSGMMGHDVLRVGLAIPVGGAVLVLVPMIVVRMLGPVIRESLDGFLIGALGATSFTAAATLTRLAPQVRTGTISHDRPLSGLVVQAGIRGVALPVIAAAVGGMVGAALWFQRRQNTPHRKRVGPTMVSAGAATLVIAYGALGVTDAVRIPQLVQLGVYALVTVLVLLALRVALQVALLNEYQERSPWNEPVLCPQCSHVVPDMAFCPNCGAAAQASSRSSRSARRRHRPIPVDEPPRTS